MSLAAQTRKDSRRHRRRARSLHLFMERVTHGLHHRSAEAARRARATIDIMGQKVRDVATATTPSLGPRITFPNVLGGRDTFAPIRGMLLGPGYRRSWSTLARRVNEDDEATCRSPTSKPT